MRRKRLLKLKRAESEKLRERAINCHRLAVGAGDPQFTVNGGEKPGQRGGVKAGQ